MASVTKTYLLAVVSIAIGASYQFFNFNIVNTSQTVVVSWINETYAARDRGRAMDAMTLTYLWSAVSSACLFGSIFGSLLTQPIAERLGRRYGLVLTSLTAIFGGCLCLLAKNVASPELLICARFILGLNVGACCGLAPLYLTEISPVKYRGAAGTAHMLAIALGDLSSMVLGLPQLLGTPSLWSFAFAWPIVPALIFLICLPFVPESPRYLLFAKNDLPRCRQSLEKLVHKDLVEQEVAVLIKEASRAHHQRSQSDQPVRSIDLFRHRWLR
uniref:Major facilitator superfamily (MFS) profile domain-containing protein n=1 Tax=Plectus sambesii TaxID=2011161 RepID=A0A914XFX3_9BILA